MFFLGLGNRERNRLFLPDFFKLFLKKLIIVKKLPQKGDKKY